MTDVVIGSVEEIPVGEGRTFAVDGKQIAVFRLRDGSLRAIDAVCPHKGGPLADGLSDDRVVVCPLHGYTFDMGTGIEAGGADISVRSYAVSAVDGTIRISRPA
ncbi:Rieske (2Fe-2S) protein [Mycolicibacterium moriokaense]|uniref:Nitrite reductase (NADH) small subunit n=1 Tax=Mycolicibacterium moriokaense TaxID=39691 RepID=A0A318HGR7_9MYCO|nr:Rieske 2Fe-2S domain-containing protein [Mycolicibacterium moriokaense]PXX08481.1 nitrite reductase (NADH) small subunit [Mycolicibacterium moriokaense]